MPYLSQHRLASAIPHYDTPPSPGLQHAGSHTMFAAALQHVRIARASHDTHAVETRSRHTSSVVWPSAFAMMLVAVNMDASTATSTSEPPPSNDSPTGGLDHPDNWDDSGDSDDRDDRRQPGDTHHRPVKWTDTPAEIPAMPEDEYADVVRVPIEHSPIRTRYTFGDVLKAIAAGDQPFRKLSESICDAHAILGGVTLDPKTCATLQKIATMIDTATSLIPRVQQLRIPSHLAGRIAEDVEEIEAESGELDETLQLVEPRNFGELEGKRGTQRGINMPFLPAEVPPARRPTAKSGDAPAASNIGVVDAPPPVSAGRERAHESDALQRHTVPPMSRSRATTHHSSAGFPVERAPEFLVGDEHAPLDPCSRGGGSPSREATSARIAIQHRQIANAVRHLPEEPVRIAIERAFHDVDRLRLVRPHRGRDNAVAPHSATLAGAMEPISPKASLLIQQREASRATTAHYDRDRDRDGDTFCQEGAEMLFHYLLENGVPDNRIRMITVHPHNRAPHVMVLYTESRVFIDLLELATPQPSVAGYIDGIDDASFAGWISLTRDSTVLLDPSSHIKAAAFVHTTSERHLVDTLDVALVDTGHRPGSPYVVSITRPLGMPRRTSGTGRMSKHSEAPESVAGQSSASPVGRSNSLMSGMFGGPLPTHTAVVEVNEDERDADREAPD